MDTGTSEMGMLQDPRRFLLPSLWRAFNNGAGWLCLGLAAATFAALSYHIALVIDQRHSMQTTKQLRAWLTGREPVRIEPYAGLSAALLSVLEDRDLAPGADVTAGIDRVWNRFRAAVAQDGFQTGKLPRLAFRQVDWRRDRSTRPIGNQLGPLLEASDPTGALSVLVPSVLNHAPPLDDSAGDDAALDRGVRLAPRVKRATRAFTLLAAAVAPDEANLAARRSIVSSPSIVQIYFVSTDGVLALWSPDQRMQLRDFPHWKTWNTASYVTHVFDAPLRDGEKPYETPAYFDYGGHGVVRTQSRAVFDPKGELLGCLCFDWTVPVTTFLDQIAESGSLESEVVATIDAGGERTVLAAPLDVFRAQRRRRASPAASDGDDLLADLQASSAGGPAPFAVDQRGAEAGRSIVSLGADGDRKRFAVPLGRVGHGGIAGLSLLVSVAPPRTPAAFTAWSAACMVAFATCLFALIMGALAAAQQRERNMEVTLLRGLPLGVVWVDPDEVIQTGNDAAEQILQTRLPKLGALSGSKSLRWTDVIDRSSVRPVDSRTDARVACPTTAGDRYDAIVAAARDQGRSSEYLATLRRSGRVIRVIGVPVDGKRPGGSRSRRTFGVFWVEPGADGGPISEESDVHEWDTQEATP
jgi:hypothetical protein